MSQCPSHQFTLILFPPAPPPIHNLKPLSP